MLVSLSSSAANYYLYDDTAGLLGDVAGADMTLAFCQAQNPHHGTGVYKYTRISSNYCQRSNGGSWVGMGAFIVQSGTCPASKPYEDETGWCTSAPQSTCEELAPKYFSMSGWEATQEYVEIDGCFYSTEQRMRCVPDWENDTGIGSIPMKCDYKFTPSSTPPTNFVENPTVNPAEASNEAPTGNSDSFGSRPETSETTNSTPSTTNNADGSTTTSETVTIHKQEGTDITTWETDDFIFVKEENGSTTIYQKQTNTTSNTDGSSHVNEQKSNTTTPPSTITTQIPKDANQSGSSNTVGGDTYTTNVTNNYYYDPNGNLSSSDSTSDTEGESETTDEEGNPVFTMNTGKGDFDQATTQALSDQEQAIQDLKDTFQDIRSEASQLFDISVSGGAGSLPCPPPVTIPLGAFTTEFDLCIADYQDQLSIVAVILLFIAAFLALVIILR